MTVYCFRTVVELLQILSNLNLVAIATHINLLPEVIETPKMVVNLIAADTFSEKKGNLSSLFLSEIRHKSAPGQDCNIGIVKLSVGAVEKK